MLPMLVNFSSSKSFCEKSFVSYRLLIDCTDLCTLIHKQKWALNLFSNCSNVCCSMTKWVGKCLERMYGMYCMLCYPWDGQCVFCTLSVYCVLFQYANLTCTFCLYINRSGSLIWWHTRLTMATSLCNSILHTWWWTHQCCCGSLKQVPSTLML